MGEGDEMTWFWVILGVIVLLALACVAIVLRVIYAFLVVCSEAKGRQDAGPFRSERTP